jgi:hypothetical protein
MVVMDYQPESIMFKTIQRIALAAALLTVTAVVHATPGSFNVNLVSLAPGSGYGIDANEASGNLLDVRFSALTTPYAFTLSNPGDYFLFNVGTISFREPNGNGGINGTEAGGDLSVSALFSFTNPFGGTQTLEAFAIAQTGGIVDPAVDFQLIWLPMTVPLSGGGSFSLALMPTAFNSTTQTQTLVAMIGLNAVTENEVPEPASLALIGFALAGVSLVRRKQA